MDVSELEAFRDKCLDKKYFYAEATWGRLYRGNVRIKRYDTEITEKEKQMFFALMKFKDYTIRKNVSLEEMKKVERRQFNLFSRYNRWSKKYIPFDKRVYLKSFITGEEAIMVFDLIINAFKDL